MAQNSGFATFLKYTKYYDGNHKVILSDGNHIQIKINNDFFINYDDCSITFEAKDAQVTLSEK